MRKTRENTATLYDSEDQLVCSFDFEEKSLCFYNNSNDLTGADLLGFIDFVNNVVNEDLK